MWHFLAPARHFTNLVAIRAECRNIAVQYNTIFYTTLRWLNQNTNQFQNTIATPYLAFTNDLWGVFCEDLIENLPCYNGTARYICINMDELQLQYCPVILRNKPIRNSLFGQWEQDSTLTREP